MIRPEFLGSFDLTPMVLLHIFEFLSSIHYSLNFEYFLNTRVVLGG
jgi:hypothetical protein